MSPRVNTPGFTERACLTLAGLLACASSGGYSRDRGLALEQRLEQLESAPPPAAAAAPSSAEQERASAATAEHLRRLEERVTALQARVDELQRGAQEVSERSTRRDELDARHRGELERLSTEVTQLRAALDAQGRRAALARPPPPPGSGPRAGRPRR